MDGIINTLKNLFTTYGFQATAIILLTVVIVNLLKKPIMKHAIAYAEKSGYDKSVITKNISFLPYLVAFVLCLIVTLVTADFALETIDWSGVASQSMIYGSVAVATYEIMKKQLQSYASKTNTISTLHASPAITESPKKEEPKDVILP